MQRPRIPVWVSGAWPRVKSMRRAARWDGWIPHYLPREGEPEAFTPEVLAEAVAWLRERRAAAGLDASFDVVAEGTTPADDADAAAELVRPWREAGATWWLDADWSDMDPTRVREAAERRLAAGPPRPPA